MDTALLIFLHGPGQSPPAWQDVVGAMSPEQQMVAPWLKGLKPTDHTGFDMDQAVGAIADLMEARGAAKADLVGYSLGGLVALRMAAKYPNKVSHLVLVSTPVVPRRDILKRQRMMVKLAPAAMFNQVGKEHVLAGLDALIEADLGLDLRQVTAPILSVTAENDPMGQTSTNVLVRNGQALAQTVPGSDPDLLKAQPRRLAQLITDFCADFLPDDEG